MASQLIAHILVIKNLFIALFVFRFTVQYQDPVFKSYLDHLLPHLLSVVMLFICPAVRFICYCLYSTWGFTHILVLFICLFILRTWEARMQF